MAGVPLATGFGIELDQPARYEIINRLTNGCAGSDEYLDALAFNRGNRAFPHTFAEHRYEAVLRQ